jgi:hypothetical protein
LLKNNTLKQIRLDNNPVIPEESVLGFANEEDINQYLFTHPNVTQLGKQITLARID